MTDYIGHQFGNYRLLRLLGRGGFAEVYLGEHLRLKMQAAVKVLHTNLVGEEIESFQREAQTLANLGHPHIIRILDFDVQQGIPFLVLDYAPNGSLREKHPRGTPVPLGVVVSYVQQVSSALHYAHEQRLIHRDIKPENMLVGKRGEILLGDFGIASIAHSTSSMSTQASIGTLPYMAPEQIQGKPRPASDQYALAVTAYQWLSGHLPFQGSSSEVIAQHLAIEPPPLRSNAPHISTAVEQVVMTALAKDPGQRFGSVQAFATALTQASEGDMAQRSSRSLNTSTIAPTLLATPASSTPPPPLSPQPAVSGALATPIDTPVPETIARISNEGKMPLPSYPPLPHASIASPQRKTNTWLIWLTVSLMIAVVGGIASIAIPAWVVYGPHPTTTTYPTTTTSGTLPNANYPTVDGISCDSSEQLAYHIHVHVSLYINGSNVRIPENIGIASDLSCYYWIHTHDTSGVIHIESPAQNTYTFGSFLDVWSKVFPQLQYPAQLSTTNGWVVYINGKAYTGDFRNIPLTTHTLITMGYNSPNITPDVAYNWGDL